MCLLGPGRNLDTNQYSVTEYFSPVHKGQQMMPAVWFMYDMSPILVTVHEARFSLGHLLVRLCAVIGGVFAVTGNVAENSFGLVWLELSLMV